MSAPRKYRVTAVAYVLADSSDEAKVKGGEALGTEPTDVEAMELTGTEFVALSICFAITAIIIAGLGFSIIEKLRPIHP